MKELDLYEGFEEYDEYDFIAVDENNNVLYYKCEQFEKKGLFLFKK